MKYYFVLIFTSNVIYNIMKCITHYFGLIKGIERSIDEYWFMGVVHSVIDTIIENTTLRLME